MPGEDDVATLIWGDRTSHPDPSVWRIAGPGTGHSADRWPSLHHAINYAVGMMRDRAEDDLHPWIRSSAGHVYSPAAIRVMSDAMDRHGQHAVAQP
ncbi:hypothetical protein [Aureimonas sp. AU12]|uniref:hypothetical protein n=1 Tax=Aureimonas sp. AU12 TaxID=1638161 RepID=UPI000784EE01|nr:hypothetical protein [Aureimonas sp. AU12]